MPKNPQQPPLTPDIIQTPLEDVLHQSMMPYAEYVILERAIPRVEDGLKPVQRRILYTMSELGLSPDKPHRKCARIVGDCLGKYHPHGDTSVYDALTRMAQPYSMRGVMVDGHGNFGSIDGDSAAAMRYTEARMAPLALQMLRDIEKDTVPFRLNFDDTLKEPDLLPARFPNLLVNGASGIAVGLATNIPGMALVTFYADCVPLYFVDPVKKAIGLAHSGWRGTVAGMGACMVQFMREHFHSDPKDLIAAIGPSICVDCYEVSEEVAEQFREGFPEEVLQPGKADGKYQLDLWKANESILLKAGILPEHLTVTDVCTCHNPEYLFSHRASHGQRGNLAAFLMLKNNS